MPPKLDAYGGELPGPYQGAAVCYMEMGGDKIGRVDVSFLSGPGPTALFSPPSRELAEEKRQFGASRARRWFGHEAAATGQEPE